MKYAATIRVDVLDEGAAQLAFMVREEPPRETTLTAGVTVDADDPLEAITEALELAAALARQAHG